MTDPTPDLIRNPTGGMPRLLAIMRRLRDPDTGCPWDIEQDFDTIAPYTVEEAYEVADAIARRNWGDLCDELGDLLLQAVYHAQMAQEAGHFDFDDVIRSVSDKMVARHPHVFGDETREKSAAQQVADWEAIKAAERANRARQGVLDDVALNLPALIRAQKLQNRAARVGFDWPDAGHVLDKLAEESAELVEAQQAKDPAAIADEFGDLLFVMVNLGRHLGVDAEAALRGTNEKFTRRFAAIETGLARDGRSPATTSLAEMEAIWAEAKRAEKSGRPG